MPEIFTHRDLTAWKDSMELVEACYRVTSRFPKTELYGLTSQIRRAAVSIPSNIAEGHCRRSTKAYLNHISIALGSHGEVTTCLELAARLGFVIRAETELLQPLSDSVGKMLYGLYRALERKALNGP